MPRGKPLWGSVSANGGLWVLHYHRAGSSSHICVEGYGPDVFDGFKGPVIRYDKAKLDDVLQVIAGPPTYVEGWSGEGAPGPIISLEEFLNRHRAAGVPVEYWEG